MMGSKLLAGMAALAIVFGVSHVVPAAAAENGSADVNGEASSPSPRSPIRVSVVDYEKAEEGPGTLKMSGTAIPDNTVYIYVDSKPFAEIEAGSDGEWSVADKVALEGAVHQVRVEQFDKTTKILAGRAMFSISLTKPKPEDMNPNAARAAGVPN
jgi:hypothetical protein